MRIKTYFLVALWLLFQIANPSPIISGKYHITSLPGINNDEVQQYSGYLNVNDDSRIFFWLVLQSEPKSISENLMIWLNGGPGCSSLEGMLLENGPYIIDEDGSLIKNPYSWHQHVNLLYVDQPVGTGFSYSKSGKKLTSQKELSGAFVEILQTFFIEFPNFESSKLYIAGESFAGTYIPYIADSILNRNKQVEKEKAWKLNGLLIGNGWIDPRNQYESIIDYAKEKNLLSGAFLEAGEKVWQECLVSLNVNGNLIRLPKCESIVDSVFDQSLEGGQRCLNMYDVRLRDPKPGRTCGINWPSNLQGLYTFFRNPNVISAIHASESANTWFECSDSVFNAFNNDLSSPSISFFPSLLSNVPITLYAGEHDLVCNYKGMEALIQSLNWGTQQGFSYGYPNSFFLRDSMIGTYQQERNLTYLLFMNASHMVPIDQPEGMLQLLKLTLGLESARVYLKPSASREMSSINPASNFFFWFGFLWGSSLTLGFMLLFRYHGCFPFFTWCKRRIHINHPGRSQNEYLPVHILPKDSPTYDSENRNTHLE